MLELEMLEDRCVPYVLNTYKMALNPDHTVFFCDNIKTLNNLTNVQIHDSIVNSFSEWANNIPVTFKEVDFNNIPAVDPVVVINDEHIDGPGNTIGKAYLPSPSFRIQNITMDNSEVWTQESFNGGIPLRPSIEHEIGHTLGLLHEFNIPALMNPIISSSIVHLTSDDILGVQAFYGVGVGQVVPEIKPVNTIYKTIIGSFDSSTATWYINFASGVISFQYGAPGWIPITGNWNGNSLNKAGIGVFDPATATWYLKNDCSPGAPDYVFKFGFVNSVPVVGDWDGTGFTHVGDYVNGVWYLAVNHSVQVVHFGASNDIPVAGDWQSRGVSQIGVYSPATTQFTLAITTGLQVFSQGQANSKPIIGDWSNDGVVDIGTVSSNPYLGYAFWELVNTVTRNNNAFFFGAYSWLPLMARWELVQTF